jgi:hypothetical protein
MDKFKKIVKNKVNFDPVHSTRDQDIWGKLSEQISDYEASRLPWKKYYPYIAAALVTLCTSILFTILNKEEQPKQIVLDASKQPTKQVIRNSDVPKTASDSLSVRKDPLEIEGQEQLKNPTFVTQANAKTFIASQSDYFELADGSVVALQQGSSIMINNNYLNNRELNFKGNNGYFEVAPNPNHPFKVFFANTHLEVLGTKFYIQIDSNMHTKVSVIEGKVKVFNPAERKYTVLVKDEELSFFNSKSEKSNISDRNTTGEWKKTCLVFNDTPISKVFYNIGKVNGRKIKYDSGISNCLFSGDLSSMNFDDALNFVKLSANLVVEEKEEHVYVSGNSCD